MTITETQKTAQLAADAAVSAAEAKQYMLEAEKGYQDTSAAAQQAQDAAGSALLSKQSAATSETNAAQSAEEAEAAKIEAAAAAANASDYAKNKFTFYKTPTDPDGTIAGLAATTDGQSFWVAQGPDALSAAWQYQNKAGVAVLQAKQPGTAAITGTIREFPTLAAAQADADAGNIPVGSTAYYRSPDDSALAIEVINNGGTLQPTGRKMPSQEAINAVFDFISKFIVSADVGNNYFPFFTDGADNVPLWWDDGFAVSRISSELYQMIYDDVHSRLGDALNSVVNDVSNSFFPLFIDASNNVPVWWDNGFDVSIISESLKAKIWNYINSIISPALNKAVPLVSTGFVPGMTDGADNVLFWFQDGKFDTYEVGPNISASLASAYQRRMYTAYYNMPLHTDGRTLWRWRAKKA